MQSLSELLPSLPNSQIEEISQFWNSSKLETQAHEARLQFLLQKMTDTRTVEEKAKQLGRKLTELLASFLSANQYRRTHFELRTRRPPSIHSHYELDAALSSLQRQGLVFPYGYPKPDAGYFVPRELAEILISMHRLEKHGLSELLTMEGFYLARLESAKQQGKENHWKESYKLISQESAVLSRLARLPEELKELVEKTILNFGGILPRSFFDRLSLASLTWDSESWKATLEKQGLGTVAFLHLEKYGVRHDEETLILFQEVSRAFFRARSFPKKNKDFCSPNGADLLANAQRLFAWVQENPIRFTSQGEVFRSTEKHLLEEFLESPCKEIDAQGSLDFLLRCALDQEWIEKTAEKTLVLSPAGMEWRILPMKAKLRGLLWHACEEKSLGGHSVHHWRLRRIALRLLKQDRPGMWQDAMAIALCARNLYLTRLDRWINNPEWASRANHNTSGAPLEDLQQIAWTLFAWMRLRLHPLGIIEFAYDRKGRPVALRLSKLGMELLNAKKRRSGRSKAKIIVNADFEIVLFPDDRSYELLHRLDSLATRSKSDRLIHFRLEEKSIRRALRSGITLESIIQTLEQNSELPIPQNVLFSIRDWGAKIGLVSLGKRHHLSVEDPLVLEKLLTNPQVRSALSSKSTEKEAVLKRSLSCEQIRLMILESGLAIERD